MAVIIVNSFSINMLAEGRAVVMFEAMSAAEVSDMASRTQECRHAIGHADTLAVVQGLLGHCIQAVEPGNPRPTVKVHQGDTLVVAQYSGPRLPEGAMSLPEGATITWWYVGVDYRGTICPYGSQC